MKTLFASLLAFFSPRTPAQKYIAQARAMMVLARADKTAGYTLAAKCAVQAAMSYRAAAHASRYYA